MSCELNSGSISDWVAIGVASFALLAACWQAQEARKQATLAREHNKITTLPMLVHHEEWHLGSDGWTLSLVVKNVGMGVALIKDRYFTHEKQKFSPTKQGRVVHELAELLFRKTIPYQVVSTGMFGESAKIPPGTSIVLMKLLFLSSHPDFREVVEGLAKDASFEVEYQSIYGEHLLFSTHD